MSDELGKHRIEGRLEVLERIFDALPSGAEAAMEDRRFVEAKAGTNTATYGEITPAASRRLLQWMRPEPRDHFVDVGSGVGRLALQALLTTEVGRVTAIELSPFRHAIARRAVQALKEADPELATRLDSDLDLLAGDFRDAFPADASLVYAGSICFPDGLMAALASRLDRAPAFRRIASLKDFPPAQASLFETVGEIDLDMSWAPRVRATIYGPRRRGRGQA